MALFVWITASLWWQNTYVEGNLYFWIYMQLMNRDVFLLISDTLQLKLWLGGNIRCGQNSIWFLLWPNIWWWYISWLLYPYKTLWNLYLKGFFKVDFVALLFKQTFPMLTLSPFKIHHFAITPNFTSSYILKQPFIFYILFIRSVIVGGNNLSKSQLPSSKCFDLGGFHRFRKNSFHLFINLTGQPHRKQTSTLW